MKIPSEKKIYFLSDFHLGVPDHESSLKREKKIVQFLSEISADAAAIFLVGDLFDFWFEYKNVVPKGYVRILGKMAEISDSGIPIHFFVGNHDMWMRGYFEKEMNIPVYHEPKEFEFNGKRFFIGHGDGLGPGDYGYKFLKKVFRNRIAQFLFGVLPPSIGINIALKSSKTSRAMTGNSDDHFLGEEKEWLVSFCNEKLKTDHFDYFIFGHRHLPIDYSIGDKSRYLNLGDWMRYNSYVVFDGTDCTLKYYN